MKIRDIKAKKTYACDVLDYSHGNIIVYSKKDIIATIKSADAMLIFNENELPPETKELNPFRFHDYINECEDEEEGFDKEQCNQCINIECFRSNVNINKPNAQKETYEDIADMEFEMELGK